MKKLTIIASALVALALLGGIAWALWSANSVTHLSIQMSAKPAAALTRACTNDNEVVDDPLWDPADAGPDPSSIGPVATRYVSDIANCVASLGPTESEASVAITTAYGGYYCDVYLGVQNPGGGTAWKLILAKINTVTTLADCPTMASTDLDGNTLPDIEACLSKLGPGGVPAPVLNTIWGPGEGRNLKLSVHVLDTATGGVVKSFDFTTVGEVQ